MVARVMVDLALQVDMSASESEDAPPLAQAATKKRRRPLVVPAQEAATKKTHRPLVVPATPPHAQPPDEPPKKKKKTPVALPVELDEEPMQRKVLEPELAKVAEPSPSRSSTPLEHALSVRSGASCRERV